MALCFGFSEECRSILLERSKHLSMGAFTLVSKVRTGINSLLLYHSVNRPEVTFRNPRCVISSLRFAPSGIKSPAIIQLLQQSERKKTMRRVFLAATAAALFTL